MIDEGLIDPPYCDGFTDLTLHLIRSEDPALSGAWTGVYRVLVREVSRNVIEDKILPLINELTELSKPVKIRKLGISLLLYIAEARHHKYVVEAFLKPVLNFCQDNQWSVRHICASHIVPIAKKLS